MKELPPNDYVKRNASAMIGDFTVKPVFKDQQILDLRVHPRDSEDPRPRPQASATSEYSARVHPFASRS